MSGILVYDDSADGHKGRGVQVVSQVLSGRSLVMPAPQAWRRLAAWRGTLVCCTVNNYLKLFLVVALLRHLRGRPTVALLVTDPRRRRANMKGQTWRRRLFDFVLQRSSVRAFDYIVQPGKERRDDWIYDLEWWDLIVAPLALREGLLPYCGSKKTVVFLGTVNWCKGLTFFAAAARAAADRRLELQFVFVGDADNLALDVRETMAAGGVVFVPRADDDADFVSYLAGADWVWCCYDPAWDMSSGIFGRSLQLKKRTIVRRGSILDRQQSEYGNGITVAFGDIDDLLAALIASQPPLRDNADAAAFARFSLKRLKDACRC